MFSSRCSVTMHRTCVCVNFIAEHTRAKEDSTKVTWHLILHTNYFHKLNQLILGANIQMGFPFEVLLIFTHACGHLRFSWSSQLN